jgi:hypothetical protein
MGAIAVFISRLLINLAVSLLVAIGLSLIVSWRRGDYQ